MLVALLANMTLLPLLIVAFQTSGAPRTGQFPTSPDEALDWHGDFHIVSPAFALKRLKIKRLQPSDGPHE